MTTEAAELVAGREMDTLVAEKVLGAEIHSREWPVFYDSAHEMYDVAPENWETTQPTRWGKPRDVVWKRSGTNIHGQGYSSLHRVPDYSTDIAAAEQVLDCFHQVTMSRNRMAGRPDIVHCHLERFGEDGMREAGYSGQGETIPEAICRAALAAVARFGKPVGFVSR